MMNCKQGPKVLRDADLGTSMPRAINKKKQGRTTVLELRLERSVHPQIY